MCLLLSTAPVLGAYSLEWYSQEVLKSARGRTQQEVIQRCDPKEDGRLSPASSLLPGSGGEVCSFPSLHESTLPQRTRPIITQNVSRHPPLSVEVNDLGGLVTGTES